MLLIQQRMGQMSEIMDHKLSEINKITKSQLKDSNEVFQEMSKGLSKESRSLFEQINNQFNEMTKHSNRSIQSVTEKLTKLDETNKRVVDFSSQLKDLQDILKNPKQRGVLGEYFLEETLKNVLPPHNFKMQYRFKNGEAVDAVIFVKDKIIPVDSKFSLEKYEKLLKCKKEDREKIAKEFKQDLKNRIDETSKYIRPKEKTTDFAFMFIPSESIYYDLLINKVGMAKSVSRDLIEYAFKEKHVVIVSPTSFLAYLQTVLQGLRSLQIEESAKHIQKNVEKLGRHLKGYEEFFGKVGGSLSTTVNHYNHATKELGKIDKDVLRVAGKKAIESDRPVIDRPKED
ncbi:MAG: DNA recombination protein RmuC [Candidatus Moranbacteria bacterium]|nr:DNA recombination protein RmuC [Candidatus Moranbacteria bacterium]